MIYLAKIIFYELEWRTGSTSRLKSPPFKKKKKKVLLQWAFYDNLTQKHQQFFEIMFYNFNMEIHDIHIMIAYCDAEWMILSRQWSREELYQYLQLQ